MQSFDRGGARFLSFHTHCRPSDFNAIFAVVIYHYKYSFIIIIIHLSLYLLIYHYNYNYNVILLLTTEREFGVIVFSNLPFTVVSDTANNAIRTCLRHVNVCKIGLSLSVPSRLGRMEPPSLQCSFVFVYS